MIKLLNTCLFVLVAACGGSKDSSDDRCTRGVSHVFELLSKQPGKPSSDERSAMEAVQKMSIAQCKSEGFTQPQLDCVLGATDWDKFQKLGECAAIKDRKPGWLILP